MFFKKVDQIIFTEHGIWSLQSLLYKYRQIGREYVFDALNMKKALIKEYGDDIGFHERSEKNKSEFVYDTKCGANYVEAALNSFSITEEQLILNLAHWLSNHIKEVTLLNWCLTVEKLLEEKSLSRLLLKLLSSMKKIHGDKKSPNEADLVLSVLASLINYLIT